MGWAYCGTDYFGREIGYGISATCDKRGCDNVISRGLDAVCGNMHHDPFSDEPGCGMYFCDQHKWWVGPRGGCQHRQKRPYGKTFCELMGVADHHGIGDPAHDEQESFARFYCACRKWEFEGDTRGMTLEKWWEIPGYAEHVGKTPMLTDMMESGEHPLPVECGTEWASG